jgi:hypothetical protein
MKNLILAFAFLFAMVACSDSADSTSSSAEHSQNESALNTDVLQWSYSQHSDDLSNWLDVTRCNVLRNDSLVLVQSSLAGRESCIFYFFAKGLGAEFFDECLYINSEEADFQYDIVTSYADDVEFRILNLVRTDNRIVVHAFHPTKDLDDYEIEYKNYCREYQKWM